MRLLALIGFLAIVVGIAALVFFFGGFFNVAATNPEPAPVSWALIKVRMAVGRPQRHRPAARRLRHAGQGAGRREGLHARAAAPIATAARASSGRNSPKACGPTRPT